MSDIVIKAENLGKKYVIGHQAENGRYVALRDVLMQNARSVWQKTRDLAQGKPIILGDTLEEVWALKDVNFEIERGEAVGIIGRNGAGKSTLLKILSRITEPSAGRVTTRGRVASLLEVGTGFHPELTGRENIYLNGAILGMTRVEIRRKFDEIVAFAEVEQFLDTPVKRYSSGMYVRLAFAVAAHLEPEILMVDEVLAVGDSAFQKKCLGKMGEVAVEGRTVLFVSHNMGAIQQLCERAIWLDHGGVVKSGSPATVINDYIWFGVQTGSKLSWQEDSGPGTDEVRLSSIELLDEENNSKRVFRTDERIVVQISYAVAKPLSGMRVNLWLLTALGEVVFGSSSHSITPHMQMPGIGRLTCVIPPDLLNIGQYMIEVSSDSPGVKIHWKGVTGLSFDVDGVGNQGTSYSGAWPGVVCPKLDWKLSHFESQSVT